MISCRKAAELISGELEDRLSGWQRFALKTHLLLCSGCAIARRQFRWLHKMAGIGGTDPKATEQLCMDEKISLPPEAAARIKATLEQARR